MSSSSKKAEAKPHKYIGMVIDESVRDSGKQGPLFISLQMLKELGYFSVFPSLIG